MKSMISLLALLFILPAGRVQALEEEPPCGTSIVTIGDAWEFISAEKVRLRRLLSDGDLSVLPQRLAAISSHARFMRAKAYFLFGGKEADLERKVQSVRDARMTFAALTSAGERTALLAAWDELERTLDAMAKLMPEGSLVPSSQMAHILPPSTPTVQLQVAGPAVLQAGQPAVIRFQARKPSVEGTLPIEAADLVETHGARMHAFVIHESLSDYHHVHPEQGEVVGEYVVKFTPSLSGPYRCWINLVPTGSGREEYPRMDFQQVGRPLLPPAEARQLSRDAGVDGLLAKLESGAVDGALGVNSLVPLSIHLKDEEGKPIQDVEPYMGAYAHIVAVHEDFSTLLHFHPHGAVPRGEERGGPVIDFTFRAPSKGYYRLFVQVKRGGQVMLLPFGVTVQ